MTSFHDLNRRETLMGLLAPAVVAGQVRAARTAGAGADILVAYTTRSGNTRVVAETLARDFQADLFEIRTAAPYPADYEEHVALAQRQRDAKATPRLTAEVETPDRYGTVFLAFPIWGEDIPAPIRTFLTQTDLKGRRVFPCITHGGYGPGDALETLARLAPDADLQPAFIQRCDAERDTLNLIRDWTGALAEPAGSR
ncbi:flavodoxin [Allosediminivita pacifica]|uniref:Flavodoxin n=1 Tax=Allosediminivita pacifica TaxID=1267769 RepID=A0A2T6A8Z4_9RHOB|nr:flavodoxin [Allosediminivita pacifica]PTX40297.1 flavodoxin [Allosediminivita pacifica]GGB26631.1 hypothetical protein GCM10011324_40540 [Allosediminivita pacifica]